MITSGTASAKWYDLPIISNIHLVNYVTVFAFRPLLINTKTFNFVPDVQMLGMGVVDGIVEFQASTQDSIQITVIFFVEAIVTLVLVFFLIFGFRTGFL